MLTELMKVGDSSRLHDRMGLRFSQEVVEEESFKNLIRAAIDHLKRLIPMCQQLILENDALGQRAVALDSSESLRKTHAEQIDLISRLIKIYGETDDGIRMQKGFVQKMAENNQ